MRNNKAASLFPKELVIESLKQSFVKLNPRVMFRNPIMFIVEVVTFVMLFVTIWAVATGDTTQGSFGYNMLVFIVLFATLLFANFAEAIAEAREHGDLKENAEYHAAREQQGFCEGRIQEIESKLANCQVIDVTKLPNNGKVIFGATVVLVNTDTDEEVTYQIVGDDEADIKSGLISVNSPIARGLVGKELDDTVNITTPGGAVEFEIIEVNYI